MDERSRTPLALDPYCLLTAALSRQPDDEVFRWVLENDPPSPWTEAYLCSKELVQFGDEKLLDQLRLPLHVLPLLCEDAARQGQMKLLKWLMQHGPPRLSPSVCENAVDQNDIDMVRFLVNQSPAVFPATVRNASPACLCELAKAGCPMHWRNKARIARLVEAWYTFLGLQQWAARQDAANLPESGVCDAQQPAIASCSLLFQLGQLPYDVAAQIASEALLSPQQASKIRFDPRRRFQG